MGLLDEGKTMETGQAAEAIQEACEAAIARAEKGA